MANDSSKKKFIVKNTIESLRDASSKIGRSLKEEVSDPIGVDILEQLFGIKRSEKQYSGDIEPGGSMEMKDLMESGSSRTEERAKKQLVVERRLVAEERAFVERRTNELRVQIDAIHEEIIKIAEETPRLSQEVQVAAFAAPGAPSEYELNFLQELFSFIRDFRKKIENASIWLAASNQRAAKKNAWGQNYKKGGAKYLLSGEHYLTRSAG